MYWNTADIENDDPLLQNDWWQAMVGIEFWVGSALMQINAGQRQVADWEGDATFENLLLGQPNKTVNVVAGTMTDSYFQGDALELSLLYAYLWDNESGELVALRLRPSFTYNFADGIGISFLPSYSNEIGIETVDLYTEVKYSF